MKKPRRVRPGREVSGLVFDLVDEAAKPAEGGRVGVDESVFVEDDPAFFAWVATQVVGAVVVEAWPDAGEAVVRC
jgi:hypothetical protein